jgi:hypothetical protein
MVGVSDLALPAMLPKGLGALGYGLDPDIVVFLLELGPSMVLRCLKCNAPAQVIMAIGVKTVEV